MRPAFTHSYTIGLALLLTSSMAIADNNSDWQKGEAPGISSMQNVADVRSAFMPYCNLAYTSILAAQLPNGIDAFKFFNLNKDLSLSQANSLSRDKMYYEQFNIEDGEDRTDDLRHVIQGHLCERGNLRNDLVNVTKGIPRATICFTPDTDFKSLINTGGKGRESHVLALAVRDKCVAYYSTVVFADQIELPKKLAAARAENDRQAKLTAEREHEAQKKREQDERAEKERKAHQAKVDAENARLNRLKQRENIFFASGASLGNHIIWGNESRVDGTIPEADLPKLFNEVNKIYQGRITLSDNEASFSAPNKGEFEKTADYSARVAALRAEHDRTAAEKRLQIADAATAILEAAFIEVVGTPAIDKMEYDADSEMFLLNIQSVSHNKDEAIGYQIPATLNVPIDEARNRRSALLMMKPWVLFEYSDGYLTPKIALLQNDNSTVKVDIQSSPIPIAFTAEQLKKYYDELAAIEAKERAERAAELERRAAQRAKERANWPAGAVAKLQRGALVCESVRSIMKAQVIRRANNPYVSMPSDCLEISDGGFVSTVQYLNGGLALVSVSGIQVYTLADQVYE